MRVDRESDCNVCGGKGIAKLGFMPSVILDPSEEARWILAESCIHCGSVREAEENVTAIRDRVKDYVRFLEEHEIAQEGELDHLI